MPKESFEPRQSTLGEILVHVGVITQAQLNKALGQCDPAQQKLGQVLVDLGFTTEDKILKAVSIRLGIPYFTSFEGMIEPEAVAAVPELMARRCLIVPIFRSEDSLTIGMTNPLDINTIDEIARHTGLRVLPVMTTLPNLFESIQRVYSDGSNEKPFAHQEAPAQRKPEKEISLQPIYERPLESPKPKSPPAQTTLTPKIAPIDPVRLAAPEPKPRKNPEEERSAVELATALLQEGMSRRASDIHIEPAEKTVRIRYRVDGMLQEGRAVEKGMESALVARIKILAKLDITETRLPQDGHLRFDYAGRGVDIRVSVLPTVYGEKVVLRILDSSKSIKKLPELGLSKPNLKSFSEAIRRPNGIVLVTGPTGSGKTTTLYAAIAELNDPTRNIVTLEDPVEYRIDRINQVETFSKIGLTFAAGLRSILRQDPNIVLVGEIRDLETAEIAIQAAITGHLVFSTLHTNDAVSTIHRLINMRVEPFLLAAALSGVMAQRLVRRLCERCKRPHQLSAAEAEALGVAVDPGSRFFEPASCDSCGQMGYLGRIAVHEWLSITPNLRELILKRVSIDELRTAAKKDGMISLQEDALHKAGSGLTSLAEVVRVTREEAEG